MDQQDLARLNTLINKLQFADSLDGSLGVEEVQLAIDTLISSRNILEMMMGYKLSFGTVNIPKELYGFLLDVPVVQWLQKSLKNGWYLISFSYYDYSTEEINNAFKEVFNRSKLSVSVVMGISFEQTVKMIEDHER